MTWAKSKTIPIRVITKTKTNRSWLAIQYSSKINFPFSKAELHLRSGHPEVLGISLSVKESRSYRCLPSFPLPRAVPKPPRALGAVSWQFQGPSVCDGCLWTRHFQQRMRVCPLPSRWISCFIRDDGSGRCTHNKAITSDVQPRGC